MSIEDTTKTDPLVILMEAMAFGGSAAIVRQEARGQRQLVETEGVLPTDGLDRIAAELGIEVLGTVDGDPMFSRVRLPVGWTKQATDHSMWSKLVNADGVEVAAMFYKAASYDRSAFIRRA